MSQRGELPDRLVHDKETHRLEQQRPVDKLQLVQMFHLRLRQPMQVELAKVRIKCDRAIVPYSISETLIATRTF